MTIETRLGLYGVGTYLPQAFKTRDLIASAGGDPSKLGGWEHVGRAGEDDHPSTMASAALERALADAGVAADQLSLLISAGVSRDYLPSWSLAMEVGRRIGASRNCFSFDLTLGCLGTLIGFEVAKGWLGNNGGGYAAIVAAERWTDTIDYSDSASRGLWSYADGAAACLVGLGVEAPQAVSWYGACFETNPEYNDLIRIEYGGTRHPTAPPGVAPGMRRRGPQTPKEVRARYAAGYAAVVGALRDRFPVTFDRMVCNQLGPGFLSIIADAAGMEPERLCVTGTETGHVGSADVLIGLRALLDQGEAGGNLLLAASTPYAFGAGYLGAPEASPARSK